MHLDLVESLRCPRGHDDGWLVAVPDVVRDRRIVRGAIGCPVCGTEWRIEDGELALLDPSAGSRDASPAMGAPAPPVLDAEALDAQALDAASLRTAALLDLRTPNAVILLAGEHAGVADRVAATTGALVLALQAPAGVARAHSRLRATAPLPMGVGTLHGARLDATHASPAWLAGVRRAVARGGRLVAPADCALPDGVRELARDRHEWVAEVVVSASGLVPLRRGGDPLTR